MSWYFIGDILFLYIRLELINFIVTLARNPWEKSILFLISKCVNHNY